MRKAAEYGPLTTGAAALRLPAVTTPGEAGGGGRWRDAAGGGVGSFTCAGPASDLNPPTRTSLREPLPRPAVTGEGSVTAMAGPGQARCRS